MLDLRDFGFWFCGVLTGVILGVAGGVLLAPQSGRRTRRKLRRTAQEAKDRLEEAAEEFASRGRSFVDRRNKPLTDAECQAVVSANPASK